MPPDQTPRVGSSGSGKEVSKCSAKKLRRQQSRNQGVCWNPRQH